MKKNYKLNSKKIIERLLEILDTLTLPFMSGQLKNKTF